jgi:flagellar basal-body rod protein FlgB
MMSLLDSALGVHAQALAVRSQRVEVLARNIANADTPNFKAQDLDFKQVLKSAQAGDIQTTNSRHIAAMPESTDGGMKYRVPFNVSFDGNTVEMNVEQAQYGKAAADYQATLNFLENKISGMRKALRGE